MIMLVLSVIAAGAGYLVGAGATYERERARTTGDDDSPKVKAAVWPVYQGVRLLIAPLVATFEAGRRLGSRRLPGESSPELEAAAREVEMELSGETPQEERACPSCEHLESWHVPSDGCRAYTVYGHRCGCCAVEATP